MDIAPYYPVFAEQLLAFIRARVASRSVAEDIHHDVWVKAMEYRGTPDPDHLRRWLFRVAKNAVIDHGMKASTRHERAGLGADAPHPTTGPGCDPLEAAELSARLRGCVEGLPPPYRQVVEARLEGLSPAEIAELLKIPRGTVDTRFFKAKAQLAECIGADQ